ncbi:MAG: hypothetical protein IKI70_05735 [Bacteroidales bacterium]|nr:hypothetical protein [Bacteroidales bacterium]
MKKLFRMALVLALAGSALLYTSCTKDYSPDIKSLQEQIDNINTSTTDGLPYVRTQLENLKSELGTLSSKVNTELSGKISALETKVDNAISSINDAIAKKADKSYVEAELADLKDDIADLVERLDAIDGEDGRLAEIDAAIEALQTASGAIDDLFATYAKFIQSIAYVPATTSGVVEAFPYTLVDGTTSDTLVVASFKITPPDARTRASLENSALVAVKTKSAAAAPDTLKIKKLVYRDDAPGYVDVFATLDGILDQEPALDQVEAEGSIAIAFAVQQVENTLTESVTSDYAPVQVGEAHTLLFQIFDAEAGDIVNPETEDHEVRVSPTTKPDSVAVFTSGRWSVVADLDGAYLTPDEAKDLFGVKIAAVSPKAGDTLVEPKADKEGYYDNNYGTGKKQVKDAFKVSAWPKRPKTVVDCIVDSVEYYKIAVSVKNSHADGPASGKAIGVYHAVPDSVELNLTPVDKYGQPQDVVIPWDYKYYDNIKDTLIAKIKVDGDRANLVGADKTPTWNTVTNTDYTEGTGAVTEHSNDKEAIDANLVSAAEYGKIDSTYVYSIQKFDRSTATEYVGNFEYVVEARPADAVIELGPIDTMVHYESATKIAVEAITAAYNFHKDYYAKYPLDTVAADAAKMGKVDSMVVTFNGKKENITLSGDGFGFADGKETTNFALPIEKVGEYKVFVYTHFANVGYTFVVTINAANNPAQIAPKQTYVTVDSETHYSVQVKGDVDTAGTKVGKYHYYLVDQPFQDYIKVINYAFGSDSLMIDLQTITKMPADTAVKAPATPVAVTRLAADSTVAQLADKANYEWDKWDSLAFEVAVRLIPEVKKDATVDSVAVKLWTVDPIPVFDGGDGIVVEHEKDQLAKTNVIAGINIKDFNGIALNDSTGLRKVGIDSLTNELVVDYDQDIEIGDIELVSGADHIEELKLSLDKETGDLSLDLNQGVIVTPIVVRVPIKLTYMLDRGLDKTAYVYITFVEKGTPAPADGE